MSSQTKEQEILMVMRKVLASIIKDTTPPQRGMRHVLSDATIEDVRKCLGLISAREKELADAQGRSAERPYYADQPQSSTVVPIGRIGKPKKDEGQ